MNDPTPIRVMIVDDHALVREGVASLLAASDDILVVGTASGALEALERCGEVGAEVVLMDLSMPDIDGATATALFRQQHPGVKVVVLTGHPDDTSVRAAIQAGARACLLKTVGVQELIDAVRAVTEGRSTFSSEFLPHLVQDPDQARPGALALTPREGDILRLVASGLTNKRIARELGLTDGTVRMYVSALLTKLGVANRTEATVVAMQEGLVDDDPAPPPRRHGTGARGRHHAHP